MLPDAIKARGNYSYGSEQSEPPNLQSCSSPTDSGIESKSSNFEIKPKRNSNKKKLIASKSLDSTSEDVNTRALPPLPTETKQDCNKKLKKNNSLQHCPESDVNFVVPTHLSKSKLHSKLAYQSENQSSSYRPLSSETKAAIQEEEKQPIRSLQRSGSVRELVKRIEQQTSMNEMNKYEERRASYDNKTVGTISSYMPKISTVSAENQWDAHNQKSPSNKTRLKSDKHTMKADKNAPESRLPTTPSNVELEAENNSCYKKDNPQILNFSDTEYATVETPSIFLLKETPVNQEACENIYSSAEKNKSSKRRKNHDKQPSNLNTPAQTSLVSNTDPKRQILSNGYTVTPEKEEMSLTADDLAEKTIPYKIITPLYTIPNKEICKNAIEIDRNSDVSDEVIIPKLTSRLFKNENISKNPSNLLQDSIQQGDEKSTVDSSMHLYAVAHTNKHVQSFNPLSTSSKDNIIPDKSKAADQMLTNQQKQKKTNIYADELEDNIENIDYAYAELPAQKNTTKKGEVDINYSSCNSAMVYDTVDGLSSKPQKLQPTDRYNQESSYSVLTADTKYKPSASTNQVVDTNESIYGNEVYSVPIKHKAEAAADLHHSSQYAMVTHKIGSKQAQNLMEASDGEKNSDLSDICINSILTENKNSPKDVESQLSVYEMLPADSGKTGNNRANKLSKQKKIRKMVKGLFHKMQRSFSSLRSSQDQL